MKTTIYFGQLDLYSRVVAVARTITAGLPECVGASDSELYEALEEKGIVNKIISDIRTLSYIDDTEVFNKHLQSWLKYNHTIHERPDYRNLIAWLKAVSD